MPARTGWVTDAAGSINAERRRALDAELSEFEKRTGFEVAVVVVDTLEGKTIEDYSFELAKSWKVGKAGLDNGVVLLLAMREHKSRIETGKGVGHLLTDVESARILDGPVRARLRANDVAGAVAEGTHAIERELSDAPGSPAPPASGKAPRTFTAVLWLKLILLTGGGALLLALWVVVSRALEARAERRREAGRQREAIETALDQAGDPEKIRAEMLQDRASEIELAALQSLTSAVDSLRQLLASFEAAPQTTPLDRSAPLLSDLKHYREKLARLRARGHSLRTGDGAKALHDAREAQEQARALIARVSPALLVDEERELTTQSALLERAAMIDGTVEILATCWECRRKLRAVIDRIEGRLSALESQASSLADLDRRMREADRAAAEAAPLWQAFCQQFPGEKPGPAPAVALFDARSCQAKASSLAGKRSASEIEAFSKALDEADEAISESRKRAALAPKLTARRTESEKKARDTLSRVETKLALASNTALSPAGEAMLAQSRQLAAQGRAQLDLGDRGDMAAASSLLFEAETAADSAIKMLYVSPSSVSSSSSSGSSGSSGSSYDSGSGGSSGSSYDSSSSSSYDSGSSSSYDSGSSGSSYDSGSSGGGGDYGGGGSSSDW